jgi:hypothetical protein
VPSLRVISLGICPRRMEGRTKRVLRSVRVMESEVS